MAKKINRDIQAVKDAMPFAAKMKLDDGTVVEGRITGRQCAFPHFAYNTHNQHIGCEVSWDLALGVLLGNVEYIRY